MFLFFLILFTAVPACAMGKKTRWLWFRAMVRCIAVWPHLKTRICAPHVCTVCIRLVVRTSTQKNTHNMRTAARHGISEVYVFSVHTIQSSFGCRLMKTSETFPLEIRNIVKIVCCKEKKRYPTAKFIKQRIFDRRRRSECAEWISWRIYKHTTNCH